MQRRGGVIHGEDQEAVGGLAGLAVDARDGLTREELPHRVSSERDDDPGLQNLEVAEEPHVACRYLFW